MRTHVTIHPDGIQHAPHDACHSRASFKSRWRWLVTRVAFPPSTPPLHSASPRQIDLPATEHQAVLRYGPRRLPCCALSRSERRSSIPCSTSCDGLITSPVIDNRATVTIITIEPVVYITRIPVMTDTSNIGTTKQSVGESGPLLLVLDDPEYNDRQYLQHCDDIDNS